MPDDLPHAALQAQLQSASSAAGITAGKTAPPPVTRPVQAIWYNPKIRAWLYQIALLAVLVWAGYEVISNALVNLRESRIATGVGFFDQTAGFSINQTLISYQETDTYGRAFVIGLLNTILISAIGILFATLIGFLVGIARLSPNWLLSKLAGGYVELIRNLPLLFQILFWYLAVLGALPIPRVSLSFLNMVFLNNRGLFFPSFAFTDGAEVVGLAFAVASAVFVALVIWAKRRRVRTGAGFPVFRIGLAGVVAVVGLALAATGFPLTFDLPHLRGFNFQGGAHLIPEFMAMVFALSTYTAAFIAEIVRAGILAVPEGQSEAARALGLSPRASLRFVIVPQALRVIVPPLSSQYLNLTKNSSLAVAIGFPELFAVFAGTTLTQTGQAIEIVGITMLVYLVLSLAISGLMNLYNARIALRER